MRSVKKFVFSHRAAKLNFSLLQVVVFLVRHLYPSWVRSRRRNTSFLCEFFQLIWVRGTLKFVMNFESRISEGAIAMEWTTPQHEEIDLNCEISSYANAEL